MKLCFSTLGCPGLEAEQILHISDKFRIKGLELRGIGGQLDNRLIPDYLPERIAETAERFAAHGVIPVALDTSCAFHDPARLSDAIDEGIRSVGIASALKIPFIRVFGNFLTPPAEETFRRLTDGISALCDAADGKNVTVLLETHGDFNTVPHLEPVLTALGTRPSFGILWDVLHNYEVSGGDWRPFYRFIRPWIRHVHIKDWQKATDRQVLPGEGDLPLGDMVSALLADGYDGYFSLEWEKVWHPELPDLPVALERFVRLMNAI